LIEFPKLPLPLDFINRGFDIRNRCQILWPRRALFHGENLSEGEDANRAPFKVNHDAARKQILEGSPAVDSAQTIEVAESGFQKNVPWTDQMSFVGLKAAWVAPCYGFYVTQNVEQTLYVLRSSAMHDVEIPGGRGHTLQNGRSHSDDDYFHSLVSESKKNLAVLRAFGFHGEAE